MQRKFISLKCIKTIFCKICVNGSCSVIWTEFDIWQLIYKSIKDNLMKFIYLSYIPPWPISNKLDTKICNQCNVCELCLYSFPSYHALLIVNILRHNLFQFDGEARTGKAAQRQDPPGHPETQGPPAAGAQRDRWPEGGRYWSHSGTSLTRTRINRNIS